MDKQKMKNFSNDVQKQSDETVCALSTRKMAIRKYIRKIKLIVIWLRKAMQLTSKSV